MPSMDGQLILVSTFGGRSGQATLSSQLLREACGLSVADRQRPLVPVPCGTRVARLGSDVLIARAEHEPGTRTLYGGLYWPYVPCILYRRPSWSM